MNFLKEKELCLRENMERYAQKNLIVAFSGGVDSSLVLKLACDAAKKNGGMVYAITIQTMLHDLSEIEDTRHIAEDIGAIHIVIEVNELEEAGIRNNPTDRCYRCKKLLFFRIWEEARKLGIETILEGTNEDDLHVYRPGIRALQELSIVSPLAEAGLSKGEVRRIAESEGLSVAAKPAAPCLATRFPYDTSLTWEKLKQVGRGEDYLKGLGFQIVRLRVHNDIARIEIPVSEFSLFFEKREDIIFHLKKIGYQYITLDLEGFRSGSMDLEIALEMK